MGREAKFRKVLSMPGRVAKMRRCFERIEDGVLSRGLSLSDRLMSGLAIFALKHPSLPWFDRAPSRWMRWRGCQVDHLLDRRFNTLSGGEQQRVQFARCRLQVWRRDNGGAPRYLLLDEPTSSLDLDHELLMLRQARR